MKRTGFYRCENTPYYDAADAWRTFGLNSSAFRCRASKEFEFLESLLPKKKVKK